MNPISADFTTEYSQTDVDAVFKSRRTHIHSETAFKIMFQFHVGFVDGPGEFTRYAVTCNAQQGDAVRVRLCELYPSTHLRIEFGHRVLLSFHGIENLCVPVSGSISAFEILVFDHFAADWKVGLVQIKVSWFGTAIHGDFVFVLEKIGVPVLMQYLNCHSGPVKVLYCGEGWFDQLDLDDFFVEFFDVIRSSDLSRVLHGFDGCVGVCGGRDFNSYIKKCLEGVVQKEKIVTF